MMCSHSFAERYRCIVSKSLILITFAIVFISYSQKVDAFKDLGFEQDPNVVFIGLDTIQPSQIQWTSGKMAIAHGQMVVTNGIGKLSLYIGGKSITGDVASDGEGNCVYSNIANITTSGAIIGKGKWNDGTIFGITAKGHALGVIKGTGKLYLYVGGKSITIDVKKDENGVSIYSNMENITTSGALIGSCQWNAGTIIGIMANGRTLGVISGTGEASIWLGEKGRNELTCDVTADGKGGCIYNNLQNYTTISDYWDGQKMWNAGAVIGITNKGKSIGVISGTRKVD